ncbi:hypothetical protein [Streptomyces parvulus]|uniref:hypothetical protein n=1 Tax=Streptomyces parvulus TaxID=146923 RepID=UPI0034063C37
MATAQAELDDARATLATLEEQVRDGDDVTPQQLSAQRELISFAELRVEAAQRTEARMREDERAELAGTAKTAATDLLTGDSADALAAAAKTAADALATLAGLAFEWNAKVEEIGTTLAGIDADLTIQFDAEPWGSKRYGIWGARDRVSVPGVGMATQMDVGALTVTVLLAGLTGTPESRAALDQHGHRFTGLRNLTARGFLEAFPAVAEALRATPQELAAADQRSRVDILEQGRGPQS